MVGSFALKGSAYLDDRAPASKLSREPARETASSTCASASGSARQPARREPTCISNQQSQADLSPSIEKEILKVGGEGNASRTVGKNSKQRSQADLSPSIEKETVKPPGSLVL